MQQTTNQKFEKPKVCLIDLGDQVFRGLEEEGFNVTQATLGTPVDVPNTKFGDSRMCLPNHFLPTNLQEFEVFIIDLKTAGTIRYEAAHHQEDGVLGRIKYTILVEFPQTLFEPRPYGAHKLGSLIKELCKRHLLIVFSGEAQSVQYQPVEIEKGGYSKQSIYFYSNYEFSQHELVSTDRIGTEITINHSNFYELLNKYKNKISYQVIFNHPTYYDFDKNRRELMPNFERLISNVNNEIVSFFLPYNESGLILFPQVQGKLEFLKELLSNYLPGMFPTYFPFSTEFQWLKNPEYQVPGEKALFGRRKYIENEFTTKLETIDSEIRDNYAKYKWLHDLITETGDKLVDTVEEYLRWLEFPDVRNMDKLQPGREEDLQVDIEGGLLVVEVKGLAGTSTDEDCRQVGKIMWRRREERQKFDVFALYVVNHQRFLPPLERDNPPFTEQQIQDAKNEQRAMLTTFELFKLYFAIENGFINKDDARRQLLTHGVVKFTPSDHLSIGKPSELHYNSTVVICRLENVRIKKGDDMIIESDQFERAKILNIQVDGRDVNEVTNGAVGIELDRPATKDSELFVKLAQ